MNNIKFVFFGTSELSVGVLDVLKEKGLLPTLVVTAEDKPQGRGLEILPSPTKVWAEIHNIPVYQPSNLKNVEVEERLKKENADVFIVAAYGKLIPKSIFELPPHKTLNVHPSLLPRLRGASPIQSAILEEDETGVTIMEISEKMDEGPIVVQEKLALPEWPTRSDILLELSAKRGGDMLAEILPKWINGDITPVAQDHSCATFCKKIEKQDGLLDLNDSALTNLRKVRAYYGWPGTWINFKKKNSEEQRVVIKEAEIIDDIFTPTRIIPAGKKEMDWQDFLRGNN